MPFERDVATTAHLPNASKAWGHRQPDLMPRLVFFHFGRQWRARPHYRHGTLDDVEQLRQFVEAELAQDFPERVDARVVLHLECLSASFVQGHEFFFTFFGIDIHAAEFVHRKFFAVLANSGLLEYNGALWIANLDCKCAEQEERRQQEDATCGADKIECTLDDAPVANLVRVLPNFRHGEASQREETPTHAVEFVHANAHLLVLFFLEARVKISFEYRFFGAMT